MLMLGQLLNMGGTGRSLSATLIKSVYEHEQALEKRLGGNSGGERYDMFSLIAQAIGQFASGHMTGTTLCHMLNTQRELINASSDFPSPFNNSPAVHGGLDLLRHAYRSDCRLHDIGGISYRWKKRLIDPANNDSVGELKRKHPYLMPVMFNSRIKMSDPRLYYQFFGPWPALALRDLKPATKRLLSLACNKQPMKDVFALCPLPAHATDDRGKDFWFDDCTWDEQLERLKQLQRQFPGVTVRAANLPELFYMDLSMRLATGDSPMQIWDFHCPHTSSNASYIKYGHDDQYGGRIKVVKANNRRIQYGRILPLFILQQPNSE